jgi:hypothetical protein
MLVQVDKVSCEISGRRCYCVRAGMYYNTAENMANRIIAKPT